jgi:hypothetical protein
MLIDRRMMILKTHSSSLLPSHPSERRYRQASTYVNFRYSVYAYQQYSRAQGPCTAGDLLLDKNPLELSFPMTSLPHPLPL